MISFHPASKDTPYRGSIAHDFVVYSSCSVPVLARIMRTYSWSPIIWTEGRRLKANFLRAEYFGLDYDKPHDAEGNPVNLETVSRHFCDTWHMIGTTRSHQKQKGKDPPCDRFRVLLKAERTITSAAEYEHNIRKLVEDTGADPGCVDAARFFFKCGSIVGMNTTADAWPVEVPPDEGGTDMMRLRYVEKCRKARAVGRVPPFAAKFLTTKVDGNSLHVPRFKYGCDMARGGWSMDEAMAMMLASPNFAGKTITPKLLSEYERVMRDAYMAVATEEERKTPA